MSIGLSYDGMTAVNDFLSLCEEAGRLGVDSVWIAEHFCFRDAFVTAEAVLANTPSLTVVPGPVSPYARHPMTLAMAAATLDELAPGRIGLHLGTGNPNAQAEFGVEVTQPLATMREAIESVRALLEGVFVSYKGTRFTFDGAKMGFTVGQIPIYLAAIGPNMLAAAGRHADGVVLSAGLSPKFVTRSLQTVESARLAAGRVQQPFRRVAFVAASAAPTTEEAYDTAKGLLSYLFRTSFLEEDWSLNKITVDNEAILAAIRERDWERARRYVSDKAVAVHSVSGNPEQFKERLQAYLRAGCDLPVLMPLGSPERQLLALQLAAEVVGS